MYRQSDHMFGPPQAYGNVPRQSNRPAPPSHQTPPQAGQAYGEPGGYHRSRSNDPYSNRSGGAASEQQNRPQVSTPVRHNVDHSAPPKPTYSKTVSTPYRDYSAPKKESRRNPGASYNSTPVTLSDSADVPIMVRGTYSVRSPEHTQTASDPWRADVGSNATGGWMPPPPPPVNDVISPPPPPAVRDARDGPTFRQRSFEQPMSPPQPSQPPPPPPPPPPPQAADKHDVTRAAGRGQVIAVLSRPR